MPVVKVLEKEETQGICLWTDGGCRPTNPGNIGWGVHGYLFENTLPKKGAGNPTHVLTSSGYILKSEKEKLKLAEVKTISYIDGFGSSLVQNTNNVAEIQATAYGLEKAKEYNVTEVNIYTDSEYVRKGVHEWSPIWLKRNWVRADGTPVPNAEEWKKLLAQYDALILRGVAVKINWVKGHDGNLGNEIADKLATVGVLYSMSKKAVVEFKVSAAEGYWKSDNEKHPFFSNRRMYFNTLKDSIVVGEYYLGEHGKDDELLGKKISDGAYCVTQLSQPEPIIEIVRNYQSLIAKDLDTIVMVRLDKLFSPNIYKQLTDYGHMGLIRQDPFDLSLSCLDKDPITKELKPPRLAIRAIQAISTLKEILERHKIKDDQLQYHNLTDILYDTESVQKKDKVNTTMKFKAEYNVGFCALPLELEVIGDDGPSKIKLTLTLGIDIPNRNSLKRLETMNPMVELVFWKEAPNVLRYATVITSGSDKGIWAGVYSNMVFIIPSKKS